MKVTLTAHEMLLAGTVGLRRRLASMESRGGKFEQNLVYHKGTDTWDMDILSAMAEMAVAKALNVYWDGSVNTFKMPDLQGNIQVRHTKVKDGRLIVRPSDQDDDIFVLVTGTAPTFTVVGKIDGWNAKNNRWWTNPNGKRGCFMVPQRSLGRI